MCGSNPLCIIRRIIKSLIVASTSREGLISNNLMLASNEGIDTDAPVPSEEINMLLRELASSIVSSSADPQKRESIGRVAYQASALSEALQRISSQDNISADYIDTDAFMPSEEINMLLRELASSIVSSSADPQKRESIGRVAYQASALSEALQRISSQDNISANYIDELFSSFSELLRACNGDCDEDFDS